MINLKEENEQLKLKVELLEIEVRGLNNMIDIKEEFIIALEKQINTTPRKIEVTCL